MGLEKIERIDEKTKSVTTVIPLSYPVPIKGAEGQQGQIYQVELGRLKVKHMKALPTSFLEKDIVMTPADCRQVLIAVINLPIETIDEIDLVDVKNIVSELKLLLK